LNHLSDAHGLESLAHAARLILDREDGCLPDLSHITVLLPNQRISGDLARDLEACAACPLLLPRLTTLEAWPDEVLPPAQCTPDSQREAMLYTALKERRWPAGQLWPLCAALLSLMHEMTRHRVRIPARAADFEGILASALGCRTSGLISFEAGLVHAAWQDLTSAAKPDRTVEQGLRLAKIAASASGPLYALNPGLTPLEESFLAAYAESQPVCRLHVEPGDKVLRSFLDQAVAGTTDIELREQAGRLRAASDMRGYKERMILFAAASLEEEARGAAARVLQWLSEGKRNIAVIAQDRMAARRLRALLERVGVLVRDETGWRLSTTIAAAALSRWLDLLASDFHHRDLLDFVKFPYPFAGMDERVREGGVAELENLIREHGLSGRLGVLLTRARQENRDAARALLEVLRRGRDGFSMRDATLAEWQSRCLNSVNILDMTASLDADPAGRQLLDAMRRLRLEMRDEREAYRFEEWREWLDRQLERESFLDTEIDSPLVFTHLAATRLRQFDAALVVGADATRLPGLSESPGFFNESVRRELGLPGVRQQQEEVWQDLVDLVASTSVVVFSWQSVREGEPNPASPWLTLFDTLHHLAWESSLRVSDLAATLPRWAVTPDDAAPLPEQTRIPEPILLPPQVPDRLSVSAAQSLIDCPYQFFARHVLDLNEPDEVREEMEKRDYGELAHRILHRLHVLHPVFSEVPRARLEADFERISGEVFAANPHLGCLDRAWALRWRRTWPAYVEWQLEREARGWRWEGGEIQMSARIGLIAGAVTLHGRLDRMDTHSGSEAVLDYKLRDPSGLKRKMAIPGEDAQLAAYGLLRPDAAHAEYVSMDRDKTVSVALPDELRAAAREFGGRLQAIIEDLHAGVPLPAHGAPHVCRFCEMSGLCRIGHW
jgi:ATP-dependent helicase/nuclease subunit B